MKVRQVGRTLNGCKTDRPLADISCGHLLRDPLAGRIGQIQLSRIVLEMHLPHTRMAEGQGVCRVVDSRPGCRAQLRRLLR